MRLVHRSLIIWSCFFLLATAVSAADLDFPYGSFRLRLPPQDEAFPGFGSYYSTIARGQKSSLWNPASLGKLKLAEASIALSTASGLYAYDKSYTLTEGGGTIDFDPGSIGSGGNYGLFFRYPADIGPGLATREIEAVGHATYATENTGLNFASALKVNDWLSVGFAANSPLGADLSIAGAFPVTARSQTSFIGQKMGEMTIATNGKLQFTYDAGGTVTTYESADAVWGEFLSQEATLPLIAFTELRNDINFESPYTGTVASKFGNLSLGLNMIPISANANIDNDIRAVVDANATDVYLYTPNFDPNDPADIQDWTLDPARYGTAAGYIRKDIKVPAGDVIGTGKYRGFYQASTTRFDLGSMYDLTDWLTVGLVLENITGSTLDFRGNGITTFLSYRGIATDESANFNDLILPGGKTNYNLISDRWTTTTEAGGSPMYLEPEKNLPLPKRMRYGFALSKPWLIAVDFEQNSSPITLRQSYGDVVIRDLSFIRIGMETQLFVMPLWLRGGITLMPKPAITGLTAEAQRNIDDAYGKLGKFGVPGFPVKLDLGADLNAWGTLVGLSLGLNPQSILNVLQTDSTNTDLSKIAFTNLTVGRDAWLINYLLAVDPLATAAAYGSKTVPAGTDKNFEQSDLKFQQTLGVTYRF